MARTTIDGLMRGLQTSEEMARALFKPNSAEFATFMCGVLSQGLRDLAEHIVELEKVRTDASATDD